MTNHELIKSNVSWLQHPNQERFFYVELEDEKVILLRINDFPDEVLFTLINGFEIMDIEDRPKGWSLG